jgi:fructose-1,6-bisphosphatase/inositol monophosphatase family enzyme
VDRDLAAACDLATELAVAAGRLQVERRGTVVIGTKAHANDLVSDVDLASENLMVDTRLWDVAAGLLIATEAGAVVDEVPGVGPELLLATTPALRPGLLALVSAAG